MRQCEGVSKANVTMPLQSMSLFVCIFHPADDKKLRKNNPYNILQTRLAKDSVPHITLDPLCESLFKITIFVFKVS